MGRVLIAAGGTGGHVYPALALGEELRDRGHDVRFVGGGRVEARLVPEAGFPLHVLPVRGLPRSLSPEALLAGIALMRSVSGARRLMKALDPDVVVGMGGYPSLAPALAAGWGRRPVVLHEQNAVLSLSHRLSLRWARVLALSLPLVRPPAGRRPPQVTETGNPLRARVRALSGADEEARQGARHRGLAAFGLEEGPVNVLVFGGSLGARTLNETLPRLGVWDEAGAVQVLHITGPAHHSGAHAAWAGRRIRCAVLPYVDAMDEAYALADLVVSRSGASTVAELTALGLPSVLIPFPHAPGGAQEANARILERTGAAVVVSEQEPDLPGRLEAAVAPLLSSSPARRSLAAVAAASGKPDATALLADLVVREIP